MKPLYKSDFASSFWCQKRKLLYHKVHKVPEHENELEIAKQKLSEIYLHLRDNNIRFYQIYEPDGLIQLKLTHMTLVYNFAHFLKSQDTIIDNHCQGVSIIHSGTFLRQLINKFVKLFQNKVPVKLVENETDAYAFLNLNAF